MHIGKLLSYMISSRENKDFLQARTTSEYLLQGSRAINDKKLVDCLENTFNKNLRLDSSNGSHLNSFTNEFSNWLNSASSKIIGLEQYQPDFSAGTTQSFDSFYYRNRDKKFRCFVGEYFYHLKVWESTETNWSFIDEKNPLKEGDALVLSLPFCDTGSLYDNYEQLLQECSMKNIPVLIDCCYYVLCGDISINIDYPCIDTVAFSLSKAFHVANMRIGVRYTRKDMFDGQKLHHSINYNNSLSAYVGHEIITNFSPDYLYKTYREKQLKFCSVAGLTPSDSVLFALGDGTWDKYSRRNLLNVYKLKYDPSMFTNRILLQPVFDNWDLFEVIKNEV